MEIVIKDKVPVEVNDFNSPYEARGFIDDAMEDKRVELVGNGIVARLAGEPKIKGHLIINEGGEYEFVDFTDGYQKLGYLYSKCSPAGREYLKKSVWNILPERFARQLNDRKEILLSEVDREYIKDTIWNTLSEMFARQLDDSQKTDPSKVKENNKKK